MYYQHQQKPQKFQATTLEKQFSDDSHPYHRHHCYHDHNDRFQCIGRKCNNLWISCVFVLIALIMMIDDKCLVTGAPAKLDSKGPADNLTGKSGKYTQLPDYILSLNDPDIGGAVEYVFLLDDGGTKSIAWDLLPPLLDSLDHETRRPASNENRFHQHNNQRNYGSDFSTTTDYSTSSGLSHTVQTENNHSIVKTPTSITVTKGAITTTTPSTLSAIPPSAIHMRNTLSSSTATTTIEPSSTPGTLVNATDKYGGELLKLPSGNSKILPPWLAAVDDPDLDVAVPYEIPADLYSYKPTVETDLVPPFEPYTDLSEPAFTSSTLKHSDIVNHLGTAKPIATTSSTRSPTTVSPYKLHWSQTKPYTTTTATISPKSRIATSTTTLKTPSHISRRTGTGTITSDLKLHSAGSTHHTTKSFNNYTPRTITSTTTTIITTPITTTTKTTSTIKPKITSPTTTTTTPTRTASNVLGTTIRPLTTSSTIAPDLDGNPFEPTIPPWLKDFDYPDVGPGVPFVYDPSADDENADHTAVASETKSQRIVPSNVLHGAANTKKTFPSDQSNVATPISTLQQPIDANYERFPPYFNVTTSYDVPLIPTKTAYSKTTDGRFLGNNQLTNGAGSGPGISTNQQNSNNFQGFSRTSGRFGGPPGILAPHGDNTSKLSTSTLQKGTIGEHHSTLSATNKEPYHNMHKIIGIFGAPPGILTPYDNHNKSKF